MPRFPDGFVDDVIARNDIGEVVGQYVHLQQKGDRLWGRCPFHTEKTGSFSVHLKEQFYYCFGCHAGGNVTKFIMEIEHCDFADAVTRLAERVHMEVPEATGGSYSGPSRSEKETMYAACTAAARWFHEQLTSPVGEEALAYLTRRGLSMKTIRRFGLGFAPDGWRNLTDALKKQGFSEDILTKTALAQKKNGNVYDMFRNRVMFPIFDERQRVVGFGGRVMDNGTPKYLNSPDTPIFNKRRNLYGLHLLKKQQSVRRVVLVEGYMDVISMHQVGIGTAVASLGTALTEEQAKLISRFTPNVVLTYDGDAPGIKAAMRGLEILEKKGLEPRVYTIPEGMDPDDMARRYPLETIEEMLDTAQSPTEYRLDDLRKKFDMNKSEERSKYVSEACRTVISRIKDRTLWKPWIEKLHYETGTNENDIRKTLEQYADMSDGEAAQAPTVIEIPETVDPVVTEGKELSPDDRTLLLCEQMLLAILVKNPEADFAEEWLAEGTFRESTQKAARFLMAHKGQKIGSLTREAEEELAPVLMEAASLEPKGDLKKQADDCLRSIRRINLQKKIAELKEEILRLAEGEVRTAKKLEMNSLIQELSKLKSK